MQIDVSAQIENAKRTTDEWAQAAGYEQPAPATEHQISERANNVRRVLGVSSFGCQERNVHALCEALLGEKIPKPDKREMAKYLNRAPFVVGSVLVPLEGATECGRAGVVTRVAQSGNAGLRLSNGQMVNNHLRQEYVRPASHDEIDAYFSEFFGVTVNPLDEPQTAGEPVEMEPDF